MIAYGILQFPVHIQLDLPVDLQLHSITSILPPRLLEQLAQLLHHVPRGGHAPLALAPGEVVVAGDVGPVPVIRCDQMLSGVTRCYQV